MRVQTVTRNCEIPQAVRDRAEEQVKRLTRFEPRLASAEVIFEEERHLKLAEGVLSVDREEPIVAQGEGGEYRAAVDQMVERLSKILRRRRSQTTDHKGPSLSEVVGPGE